MPDSRSRARPGVLGLRIDHPDGLLDPKAYLERLQEAFVLAIARRRHEEGPDREVVSWDAVERQLRESLGAGSPGRRASPALRRCREDPRVRRVHSRRLAHAGTSGYDALNRINGLFVDPMPRRRSQPDTTTGSATARLTARSPDRRSC